MASGFQNRNPAFASRALLIALLVVSLVTVTVYVREGEDGVLHSIQGSVSSMAAPLKLVGSSAGAITDDIGDALGDVTANESTLSGLRQQNDELREALASAEEYRLKAQQLQELLNIRDTYDIEGVGGRVIGRSTDSWDQTVTIDVGSSFGVETGLTVMGSSGVIGQVISVSPASSTVRLLSDPNSGAAAIVQSNRAEGVVRGSLDGLLYLENIGADVELNPGDIVLTSGLGGSYVRGLMIGTIARIEGQSGDATRRIIVAPNSSIRSLEEVIVVFSSKTENENIVGGAGSQSGSSRTGSSGGVSSSSSSSGSSDASDEYGSSASGSHASDSGTSSSDDSDSEVTDG